MQRATRAINALLHRGRLGVVAHTACCREPVTRARPYLQLATPTGVTVVWRTVRINPTGCALRRFARLRLTESVDGDAIVRRVSVDVAAASAAHVRLDTPLLYDEPSAHASLGAWRRRARPFDRKRRLGNTRRTLIEGLTRRKPRLLRGLRRRRNSSPEVTPSTRSDVFRQRAAKPTSASGWLATRAPAAPIQRRVFQAMRRNSPRRRAAKPRLYPARGRHGVRRRGGRRVPAQLLRRLPAAAAQHRLLARRWATTKATRLAGCRSSARTTTPTCCRPPARRAALPSGTEAYYSFDVAGIHFVVPRLARPRSLRARGDGQVAHGGPRAGRRRLADRFLAPPAVHEGIARQ